MNIDEVVEVSNSMLRHAVAGDWEHVAVAEESRRELLNRLFANPGDNRDIPQINRTIQKIIDINDQLETLAIDARELTRQKLQMLKDGRQAVDSYQRQR